MDISDGQIGAVGGASHATVVQGASVEELTAVESQSTTRCVHYQIVRRLAKAQVGGALPVTVPALGEKVESGSRIGRVQVVAGAVGRAETCSGRVFP